jgi:hypothetical protein
VIRASEKWLEMCRKTLACAITILRDEEDRKSQLDQAGTFLIKGVPNGQASNRVLALTY